jgi:chromosome segregation ATPase
MEIARDVRRGLRTMTNESDAELERKIAEIRQRIPPHSVPPAMLEELDELEERLDRARRQREDA